MPSTQKNMHSIEMGNHLKMRTIILIMFIEIEI